MQNIPAESARTPNTNPRPLGRPILMPLSLRLITTEMRPTLIQRNGAAVCNKARATRLPVYVTRDQADCSASLAQVSRCSQTLRKEAVWEGRDRQRQKDQRIERASAHGITALCYWCVAYTWIAAD